MSIILERTRDAIEHFEAALVAKFGVEVEILDGTSIESVAAFYSSIRSADERYQGLMITRAPGFIETKLWIVHRATENINHETHPIPEGGGL